MSVRDAIHSARRKQPDAPKVRDAATAARGGVQLFGTPAFVSGDAREPFAPQRPYQLLGWLACRGVWVTRDAAAALLWPERDTSTARANLRFVLLQIRRLPNVKDFEARTDRLRWIVESDVGRFEHAVAAGDWESAIASYHSELLEGFEANAPPPFVEWLHFERARLGGLWRNAVAARLAQLERDPTARALMAAQALQSDPLDETVLSSLLRALLAQGRADDARRAYRDYAHRLARELAIEPSAALRELARDLDASRPVARAAATRPSGAGELVGRRMELARLEALLESDECALVTITGAGGVGKSALARTAYRALSARFDDAFWIALDDLHSGDQVVLRCASTIGLQLQGTDAPDTQLHARLRSANTLLVFDNAEHLTGFAEWLDALLSACERVKSVVTSRARLGRPAEWLLPLSGLPTPDADESEIDALRSFDAVRLFEARARRAQPEFDAKANVHEVAALVRAVGGLPLAIELAAAWVRLLPVAEIRRELEQSLDLLDSGQSRSGHGNSVRDCFNHSWRLLAPAEQRALMRLSVFRGSFSRESARAVADAALPVLAALADKSVLQPGDNGRFAFHPLIQQFALERLARMGSDENRDAHARHAQHFLALLGRFEEFHALDQGAALREIGAEVENVLAAWRWAVEQRRVDLLEHCASALESYLDARGQQRFGLELLSQAAVMIDESRPAHQLARCHLQLSRAAFCYRRGDYAEGERAARSALQAARNIRYGFGLQSSTNTLGLMLWRLGRTEEAASCLRAVLRRARADEDQSAIPLYAVNLGRIELELGNLDVGEQLIREALEGSRRTGNQAVMQAALSERVQIELDRDNPAAAVPLAQEGLERAQASGFLRNIPYFHRGLSEAYLALNDSESSSRHARMALEAIGVGGDRSVEPACRVRLACIALRAGDAARALSELQAAAGLARAMASPRVQAAVVGTYAQLYRMRGRLGEACELLSLVAHHPAATLRQRQEAAQALDALCHGPGHGQPHPPTSQTGGFEQVLDRLLHEQP